MGLIAHYKLDGDARDSVGGFNGSITDITWVDGKLGQGAEFSTGNSAVTIPHNDLLSKRVFGFATVFSFSAWVYMYSWDNFGTVIQKATGGSYSNTTAGIWTRGSNILFIIGSNESGNPSGSTAQVSYQPSLNEWHHIGAVADGEKLYLYIDNDLKGTANISDVTRERTENNEPIIIGKRHADDSGDLRGIVDDVRIYDHALSEREVRDLSQGIVGHWKFDQFAEYTENVVTNTNLDTGWSKDYTKNIQYNDISPPYGVDSQVVSFENDDTSGDGYWYSYGDYAPQADNTTYTVSLWVKTDQASNVRIQYYTANNSESDRNRGDYLTVNSSEGWKRLVWDAFTTANPTDSDSLSFRYLDLYDGGYTRMYICAPQMEAKNYATPFVEGIREGIVTDSSGQGNDAVLDENSPQWISDSKIGNGCYNFDGNSSKISVSTNLNIRAQESKTYAAWIKLDSSWNAEGSIFSGKRSTTNSFCVFDDRTLQAREDDERVKGSALSTNQWYHVAYVMELISSSEMNQYLYIDGVLDTSRNQTSYSDSYSNSENFIGYDDRMSGYFNGFIDDVRVYKTALSADQIEELYYQRASIDDRGSLHTISLQEPRSKLLIDDQTKNVFDNNYQSMGTWNIAEADVSDFEEADDTLGNTYVEGMAFCSSSTYYPTQFEYTKSNNTRGFKRGIPSPTNGWNQGWNYFKFKASGYRDEANAPWNDMTRLEFYRSGPDNGVDTEQYIRLKDVKLVKSHSGKYLEPMSVGNSLEPYNVSEIGPAKGLVAWYPLDGDTKDYAGSNDGSNNGATPTARGYEFGGNDDHVRVDAGSFSSSEPWTFTQWMNWSGSSTFVFFAGISATGKGFLTRTSGSDLLSFRDTNRNYTYYGSNNAISNKEGFLCWVADGNGNLSVYVNGVFQESSSPNTEMDFDLLGQGYSSGSGYSYTGTMRDVRIYDRALSSEEVGILYKMTNPESTERVSMSSDTLYTKGQIKEVIA